MELIDCMVSRQFFSTSIFHLFGLAIGTCNHYGICSICFLRMRSLSRDISCPICKLELEYVIALNNSHEEQVLYQDFNIWGEDIGPDFRYDIQSKMFFPVQYYKDKVNILDRLLLFCITFTDDVIIDSNSMDMSMFFMSCQT